MKKILTVFGLSAFFICMTAFYHNWTLHTDIRTDESGAVADTVGRDTEQPYIPENSSTWGDLYRHFDSQGFEKLPEDQKTAEVRAMLETFNSKVDFVDFSRLAYIAESI